MDYHITFEDGSEAYLEHHGVKGMRWGVRNEETRSRYMHSGQAEKFRSKLEKQSNKLQGAAYRELNHPETRRYASQTARQAQKLTDMQARYHAKLAKKSGDAANDIDREGLQINRANRRVAAALGAGIGAAGVLGGLAGYTIAKNRPGNKEGFRLRSEWTQRNLEAARNEAKRGKAETQKLLEGLQSGDINVHGVVFDNGRNTYITSSNKKKS